MHRSIGAVNYILNILNRLEWRIFVFKIIIIIFVCFMLFGGCGYINKKLGWKDDNIVEEIIEDVIEYKTGVGIDFTQDGIPYRRGYLNSIVLLEINCLK